MRQFLLIVATLTVAIGARANWWWDNFEPINPQVKLTETNLPIVFVDVDGEMIDRDERITARIKVIDNQGRQLNYADTVSHRGQRVDYEGYIALRYRGNTSFDASSKKPYSFRTIDRPLEEGGQKVKAAILGMPPDNNWAILAPYNDRSMMRDMLAFELSRPWMDYTPQGRYCELVLDGTYYGVYIITEVVSKGKNRLNLKDPGTQGDDLTGGYLMEVDRDEDITHLSKHNPVRSNGSRISSRSIVFQYKSPDYEDMTEEQIGYINAQIDAMEDALASTQYRDAEVGYRRYLDPLSFADYQLAQEFGHNVDGYRLSAKFFKWRDSVDTRFKMALWDMNLAYGNSDYYNGWRTDTWVYQNNDQLYREGDYQLVPFWWYKLNSDSDYVDMLKQRWAQYRRANFAHDRIMALVDSIANVLTAHDAERRNSQAWPIWGQYVWPNKYVPISFDDELAYLKQWLSDRLQWMDSQLGFDPDALPLGDVNGDGVVDIIDVNAVINAMLGKPVTDGAMPDVTGDGVIDIGDVNRVINCMLGK